MFPFDYYTKVFQKKINRNSAKSDLNVTLTFVFNYYTIHNFLRDISEQIPVKNDDSQLVLTLILIFRVQQLTFCDIVKQN